MKQIFLLLFCFSLFNSFAQSNKELKLIPFKNIELSNNKTITLISNDIDKTFIVIKDELHSTTFFQEDVKKVNDFFKSKPYILDYSAGADYTYKIYIMPGHEIEVMHNWLGFTSDDINKITQ